MPGFDRTGPEGLGARTGRQEGKCPNKDSGDPGKAMGRGTGKGAGRGLRRGQGGKPWKN